ncbi:hypothetical protein RND71_002285 [Anisodus tanguticus]|uniref:VDE lipocalin domain-containing protein n=1 Tax=Anisodus tanguticus TaxID=243964 RepID=A0AAE1VRU2_9SOLA|nr:hypothetical protein RND71_002285 [Anisodus tanguticus]
MNVNVAPSSSINFPATFSVNRRSNVARIPNPFLLHYRKTKGSNFFAGNERRMVVAAVDMKEAEKKRGAVRIVSIVGEGSVSPLKSAPWVEVMLHTGLPETATLPTKVEAERLKWVDKEFEMIVFSDNFVKSNDETVNHVRNELDRADILVVVAVRKDGSVNWIQANSPNVSNIICFESSLALRNKLGGIFVETENRGDIFSSLLPFSQSKKLNESAEIARTVSESWENRGDIFSSLLPISQSKKLNESAEIARTVSESWERHNSDDIRFCLFVIINAYITPVSTLKNLRAKGFSTLNCMVTNCGPQILNCLLDPNCRKALQCLNNCSPVDQVCNYRCIASYENKYLEEFSLCVLQKNNCLELDAKIPEKRVPPMAEFRGEKLSPEIAEDLFVGWLGTLDWSWRVVAGQNPAYDQFPCQYQLFYRGKARGSFWTVIYRAVLVSPDGQYPAEKEKERLVSALDRCDIKEWELFNVDNCSCEDAPLGIPEGSSLHYKIQVHGQTHSSV